MPYFEVNDGSGFQMHYEVVPDCLPVDTLFIHGNIASNLWWYPLRDELRLRASNHKNSSHANNSHANNKWTGKMIMAEFRGCGRSVLYKDSSDMDASATHSVLSKGLSYKEFLQKLPAEEFEKSWDPGFDFDRMVQDFQDLILELKKQKIILDSNSIKTDGSDLLETSSSTVLETSGSADFGSLAVVGHSTGGLIAGLLLAQAPDLFSKALLLDPVGMRGMRFSDDILKSFKRVRFDEKFRDQIFAAVIPKSYLQQPEFFHDFVEQSMRSVDQIGKTIVHWMENVDYTERFRRIRTPVLVVHGERDIILPMSDSEEMAATIPRAQFYRAPNVGHSMNAEAPAAFADLLLHFL